MRGRPSPVEEPPTTTLRCTTTPSADAVLATVGAPLRTKGGRRESGGRTVTGGGVGLRVRPVSIGRVLRRGGAVAGGAGEATTAGVPDAACATTTVAGSVA